MDGATLCLPTRRVVQRDACVPGLVYWRLYRYVRVLLHVGGAVVAVAVAVAVVETLDERDSNQN